MAYKSFTNGFPLPASDLNNYLMDQTVIPFTDSTERDATLTAPKEGMLTFLKDTDTYTYYDGSAWQNLISAGDPIDQSLLTTTGDMIYASAAETAARLGIGSDGQVLTVASGVPSWSTLPSSGTITWDYITNITPTTGVNSISITGLTGYKKYLIVLNSLRSSSAATWTMDINNLGATWTSLAIENDGTGSIMTSSNRLAICAASSNVVSGSIFLEYNSADGGAYYSIVTGTNVTTAGAESYVANFYSVRPSSSLEIDISAGTLNSGSYSIYGGN